MYQYKAHCIEVYDADTATFLVDLGFHIRMEMTVRFYGINAPELKGPEREQGLKSTEYLRERILGKEVQLNTVKDRQEKYGRYLGTILLDGVNINDEMVAKGMAKVNFYGEK